MGSEQSSSSNTFDGHTVIHQHTDYTDYTNSHNVHHNQSIDYNSGSYTSSQIITSNSIGDNSVSKFDWNFGCDHHDGHTVCHADSRT